MTNPCASMSRRQDRRVASVKLQHGCAETAVLRRLVDDTADEALRPDLLVPGRALLRWAIAAVRDPTLESPSVSLILDMIRGLRRDSGREPLDPASVDELVGPRDQRDTALLALVLADAWLGARAHRYLRCGATAVAVCTTRLPSNPLGELP